MAKLYIVEARDHDGSLITEPGKQPPFRQASESQLFDHYVYNRGPNVTGSTWEEMRDWYESQGWFIRERTW